ncbi:MAG: hypothetical protein AAF196_08915 [Planctomycetota bacterium]
MVDQRDFRPEDICARTLTVGHYFDQTDIEVDGGLLRMPKAQILFTASVGGTEAVVISAIAFLRKRKKVVEEIQLLDGDVAAIYNDLGGGRVELAELEFLAPIDPKSRDAADLAAAALEAGDYELAALVGQTMISWSASQGLSDLMVSRMRFNEDQPRPRSAARNGRPFARAAENAQLLEQPRTAWSPQAIAV